IKNIENAPYFNDKNDKVLGLNPDYYDWNFKNEYIDKISNIKAICLGTTSYSWVDIDYCKNKNIPVTNVPKYSTEAVSEYALFMMLSLARKLPLQIKNGFKLEYDKSMLMTNIENKTVGIIGLGAIGSNIARLCTNLGMKVIYWSKTSRNENYKNVSLEELFNESDFIVPTFLVNDDTKRIITDSLINRMKKSVSIINILNEEILNSKLVIEKVKNNEIYGYAFEDNKANINDYVGNILVLPAYAWYTKEALDNLQQIWVDSIISACNNNIINQVN
ncbi:MAG TPA: NAD(P)-dependent oxidoreductase, partial [Bacilli bacterium]|nr:NAD(P)-dependent oxidoreductase [Bacilli bacterium]